MYRPSTISDTAQRTRETEPLRDHPGQFDRGGGHQPDRFAGVQVLLRQSSVPGQSLSCMRLVENIPGQGLDLAGLLTGDELRPASTASCRVVEVLAADHGEPQLRHREPRDVAHGQQLRWAATRARWNMLEPQMRVLSMSKNAPTGVAARYRIGAGIGGLGRGCAGLPVGGPKSAGTTGHNLQATIRARVPTLGSW